MDILNRIEQSLSAIINQHDVPGAPPRLAAAVRHAVFPGGARIRPQLCLAVAMACGDDDPALADATASALELLHCASLVHDDLPCFDDAAVRRGRPSVQAAFGEPLAVLCKATGLPRESIRHLWAGLRRPQTAGEPGVLAGLDHVMITYDMIAVDRAQTVLRYWNWSLSSALTPALMRAIRDGDEEALDEYSVPQRAAMLALSGDFGRRE